MSRFIRRPAVASGLCFLWVWRRPARYRRSRRVPGGWPLVFRRRPAPFGCQSLPRCARPVRVSQRPYPPGESVMR